MQIVVAGIPVILPKVSQGAHGNFSCISNESAETNDPGTPLTLRPAPTISRQASHFFKAR